MGGINCKVMKRGRERKYVCLCAPVEYSFCPCNKTHFPHCIILYVSCHKNGSNFVLIILINNVQFKFFASLPVPSHVDCKGGRQQGAVRADLWYFVWPN